MRYRVASALLTAAAAFAASAAEPADLLKTIKSVKAEGAGNSAASTAWKELVGKGPGAIAQILAAMDDADDVSSNWLRTAVDTIAERELAAGRKLPADVLEAFVLDAKHAGVPRRLAFDWLTKLDKTAPDRLIPGMLEDPGAELRRDAVARVIVEADAALEKKDRRAAAALFGKALFAARERDQVVHIADRLRTLGIRVDTAAQLGFVRRWQLIGPFDNTGKAGFNVAYTPETKVDLDVVLKGKGGVEVKWIAHTSTDPYGIVDFNTAVAKHMGAAGYAYSAFDSPSEQAVEFRMGSFNSCKVWLNGKEIFAHEEYHHGMRADQYMARGTLKKGRNTLLVKCCQNEQTDSWAQSWRFQLRITDSLGGPAPLTEVDPTVKPASGKSS